MNVLHGSLPWRFIGLFFLLVLATVEKDLFHLHFRGANIIMTTSELTVYISIFTWGFFQLLSWKKSFHEYKAQWLMLAGLLLALTISTAFSEYRIHGVRYSVHFLSGFGVFFLWTAFIKRDQLGPLVKVLIIWNVITCLVAIGERSWHEPVWNLLSSVRNMESSYYLRCTSIFSNPNIFGSISTIVFTIAFAEFILKRLSAPWFILASVSEIISVSLSSSLNAVFILGVILVASWIQFRETRKILSVVTALLFFVLMVNPMSRSRLMGAANYSMALEDRPFIWGAAFRAWWDHPWAGVGPGVFRLVNERYGGPVGAGGINHAHSIFLDFLVSTGILGFLWLLGCLRYIWTRLRFLVKNGGSTVAGWPFLVALLSQSFFDYYLDHSLPFAVIFWMAVAYSLKLAEPNNSNMPLLTV